MGEVEHTFLEELVHRRKLAGAYVTTCEKSGHGLEFAVAVGGEFLHIILEDGI